VAIAVLQNPTAYELHDKIIRMKGDAELLSLAMGEALYLMETDKLYLELSYPTFEAYLGSPEVSMGRRTAYILKSNYQKYVLELHVQPVALLKAVGETKLDLIRAYITPENQSELLAMGTSLSKSDLRIELAERFNGGIPIREFRDFEKIANELYLDLINATGQYDYQSQISFRRAKGWNEDKRSL
jgi:hypothetical protein